MFCYGAVEVPDPVPHPGVLHGADQTLLSSQPPDVVLPGEHSEIIVTESIILLKITRSTKFVPNIFICFCPLACTDLVATALPTLMPSLILDSQLMMQRTRPLGMVTTGLGPGQLSHTTPRGVRGNPWEKVAMLRPWKHIQPVSERQWTAVGWLSPLFFRYLATSSTAWWT